MKFKNSFVGAVFVAGLMTACALPQKMTSAPVAETVVLNENNTLKDAERMISSVHSEHVVVSTEALREMFRREHARTQRCEAMGEQLKALKNIDVQEIQ